MLCKWTEWGIEILLIEWQHCIYNTYMRRADFIIAFEMNSSLNNLFILRIINEELLRNRFNKKMHRNWNSTILQNSMLSSVCTLTYFNLHSTFSSAKIILIIKFPFKIRLSENFFFQNGASHRTKGAYVPRSRYSHCTSKGGPIRIHLVTACFHNFLMMMVIFCVLADQKIAHLCST